MRNLAIAVIVCIAVSAACATARKQPRPTKPKRAAAPTWSCYDYVAYKVWKKYSKPKRLLTLVKTSEDSGKVYVAGDAWRAHYYVQGVNRRWDFGGGVYAITLTPDGLARYYDFTGRLGERIEQEQTYFCRRH